MTSLAYWNPQHPYVYNFKKCKPLFSRLISGVSGTESGFSIIVIIIGIAGMMTGSFLNVVSDRLPRGISLVHPPSHCDSCGRPLAPTDLIPIFSFLWLRGRCRYCRAPLSIRIPIVEMATGVIFALLTLHYGLSLQLVMSLVYAGLFIPLFIIDMEQGELPAKIVFMGIAVALGFSFLWPGTGPINSLVVHGVGIRHPSECLLGGCLGPINALMGGVVGFIFLFVPYVWTRGRGMGGGDLTLAWFFGLATGFPLVLVALLLAILAGGVVAIALVLLRKKGRKDAMPFGPYLVTAGLIALIWGEPILKWYLRFF